ncbi:Hpt domain-containing protein [Flavobacterium sp. LB3P122]|uniref:Hpt domain-containing protein n=1 Tax=Flavobacterium algoriphilum TaxID=3398738 RepID=UPI003A879521
MEEKDNSTKKIKCIDLAYLNQKTKCNPTLMMEMIALYLAQTPPLIDTIKQSLADQNWPLLGAAAHKIIPSFSIMGISPNFENMAKKIHELANAQEKSEEILNLVLQLEEVCLQACNELEEELNIIKNT